MCYEFFARQLYSGHQSIETRTYDHSINFKSDQKYKKKTAMIIIIGRERNIDDDEMYGNIMY